ncbi:MAG: hypothetical protein M8350_00270 [Methanosarcinaceae archaeon]|nr:hypothetical protein [Methanosarcinaceae archaeon]
MGILEEIRSSTDGIIGSFIATDSGKIVESDVPALFKKELNNASESLSYLAEIAKESRDFESLLIEAQDGYVSFTKSDEDAYLGVIASSNANLQVLNIITKKASANLEIPKQAISTKPEPFNKTNNIEMLNGIDERDRDAIFYEIIGKIQILYGPKVATMHLDEALASVNATRDTTNPDQIAQALNVLENGVLKKMMGDNAKLFIEKTISNHMH